MTQFAFVGTYTQIEGRKEHRPDSLYVYRRDPQSGSLTLLSKEAALENPSFMRLHPDKRHLYLVNELVEGKASAFSVDPATGALTLLNSQLTRGIHPCYVSFDPAGKFMLISNYSSGSLAVYPILADGRLGEMSGFVEHRGTGPNTNRQERAHAHSIAFDPSGRFVLAADLGLDRLMLYRLTPEGTLVLHELAGAAMRPGAGPRHFTFHPNGKVLYCSNELDGTVTACSWDNQAGILAPFQTLSTLPDGFNGVNLVADIHLDPAGKHLYVSNRGDNSLAVFEVQSDQSLVRTAIVPCGGNWPRNFAVDPSGKWLYMANQLSSNLVKFNIDPKTGLPSPSGENLAIPYPVCVELAEV